MEAYLTRTKLEEKKGEKPLCEIFYVKKVYAGKVYFNKHSLSSFSIKKTVMQGLINIIFGKISPFEKILKKPVYMHIQNDKNNFIY